MQYTYTTFRRFISLLAILATSLPVCAFEQSNYYVFELSESVDSETASSHIVIPKETFAETDKPSNSAPLIADERSEFEIDFTQPIANEGISTFDQTLVDLEAADSSAAEDTTSSFNTESFDFGTSSNSVFGN